MTVSEELNILEKTDKKRYNEYVNEICELLNAGKEKQKSPCIDYENEILKQQEENGIYD